MKRSVQSLCKSYDRPVLKDLSYCFEAGKLYVVKGVSGCGKTTLLNVLGGVETDFSGDCAWDDGKKHPTGYIFQSSLLIANLTVRENLQMISGDDTQIEALCEQLQISALLDKYPEQLSGGERQRVATVRALLRNPALLLADEPTASLDEETSRRIAALIAALRNPGRIVIVATHEDCFDDYADEILYLNYGAIEGVSSNVGTSIACPPSSQLDAGGRTSNARPYKRLSKGSDHTRPPRLHPFRYALRHKPELLKLKNLLALAFAFLLVLLVSTVRTNFSSESVEFIKGRYPMNLVAFFRRAYEDFPYKEVLTVYEEYLLEENGVSACYLMPEQDSVFGIDGMLLLGRFPEAETEVLIDPVFAAEQLGAADAFDACLGKTFLLGGKALTVAGVTADLTGQTVINKLSADVYYRKNRNGPCVFIPYETIREIGVKQENEFVMTVCEGMSESEELLRMVERAIGEGSPNQFYSTVRETQQVLDLVVLALFGVLIVIYGMCCVFLVTIVHTDLFSRKRELGYLQIFGLSKGRVLRLILAEYVLKLFGALLLALAASAAIFGVYCLLVGRWIAVEPLSISAILILLAGIYLLAALTSAAVFLRKSIRSLISE